MEVEKKLYTLDELQTQLQFVTESEDIYCTRSIKRKLQEKYGEDTFSMRCLVDVMWSVYPILSST